MNPNGNGLGLNICKSIALCLNGDLAVTSEWGNGSCFTFSFLCTESAKNSEESIDLHGSFDIEVDFWLSEF